MTTKGVDVKIPALMACFMPWILYGLWKVILPYAVPLELLALTWMFASPLVIAAAILVAYREGQLAKNRWGKGATNELR